MSTLDIDLTTPDGYALAGQLTLTPPPEPEPMLLGVDLVPAATPASHTTFRGLRYHRVFGDGLPSLTSGKMINLPQDCVRHVSWKTFDPSALLRWLDELAARPAAAGAGVHLTYWHEPNDDDLELATLQTLLQLQPVAA
ncbi:MAG TPA: hypothetical protein VFM54_16690 [Micromonosporaceae bacterium]|nr:hypothetical protein [Micromonosporaceae bacterium]